MKYTALVHGLLVGTMIGTSVNAVAPVTLPSEDLIQPSSIELERRVEPWSPGDCAVGVPFVASYRKRAEVLVFVGAHHAFQPNSPTMKAVKAAFSQFQPAVVILEGFPTAMGENPPPLVAVASRYGSVGAGEYARGKGHTLGSLRLSGRFRSLAASQPEKSRTKP